MSSDLRFAEIGRDESTLLFRFASFAFRIAVPLFFPLFWRRFAAVFLVFSGHCSGVLSYYFGVFLSRFKVQIFGLFCAYSAAVFGCNFGGFLDCFQGNLRMQFWDSLRGENQTVSRIYGGCFA